MSKTDLNNSDADKPRAVKPPRGLGRPGFLVDDDGFNPERPDARPPVPKKVRSGPGCIIRFLAFTCIVVGVVLILAFLAGLKYSVLFLAPEETSREVVVSIPEGATSARIGQLLEEAGVIKSAEAFVWTLKAKDRQQAAKTYICQKMKGPDSPECVKNPIVLKAGEMALDPSLPVWKTIDLIAKGNYKLYHFTVPEGRNIFDIAKMVEEAGLGSQAAFLALCRDKVFINSLGLEVDSLEGYLFPNTYSFPKGTPLEKIIKTMTDSFFKVWSKYEGEARNKNMDRHDVVTLASIVEKETGVARERPMIAGVFINRLATKMRLQTDPTVIYGLLPDFDGNITKKDLQTPHPYNTYVIPGLPPGPISNPGEAAIAAVVQPDIVPFYYFVSKNDGSHDFSKTLKEHNEKVNKYQRQNRKSSGQKSGGKNTRQR